MSLRATDLLRRGASRPALMGILNATPDSFSDGGLWNDPGRARDHALDLIRDGADIIDIGGESTRPGADPVSEQEEISRIMPTLESFVSSVDVPVSIDTMKSAVARKAIEAGASIINDVSGLSDPLMARTAAELDVPLVVMSCYGNPKTFNSDFIQGNALDVVSGNLERCIRTALDAGVRECNVIVDPGVGFGTTSNQSVELLKNLTHFSFGKYPVLAGPSRKRFLADLYPGEERDEATAKACLLASAGGADILRVHNVSCVARRL